LESFITQTAPAVQPKAGQFGANGPAWEEKLVFCAGQVAADADGKVLPPDDFAAQAKMVLENLTKALAAGGAKISDVTKITIYICNPHDVPKARGVLQTYFAGNPHGSTLCMLRGLSNPNFLLEFEALAAV